MTVWVCPQCGFKKTFKRNPNGDSPLCKNGDYPVIMKPLTPDPKR